MMSHWSVFVDTNTQEASHHLLNRLTTELHRTPENVAVVPYEKTGGHKISFALTVNNMAWTDAVVEVIELGQRVGGGWQLTGSILDELEAISNEPRIVGVSMVTLSLVRDAELNLNK